MSQPDKPKRKPKKKGAYSEALAMQEVMFALAIDPNLSPSERSTAARTWVNLEEQKRIIRMKPLPGTLKPRDIRKTKKPLIAVPLDVLRNFAVDEASVDAKQQASDQSGQVSG